jgi:hypothetical protein
MGKWWYFSPKSFYNQREKYKKGKSPTSPILLRAIVTIC